jgi:hypothetical protein
MRQASSGNVGIDCRPAQRCNGRRPWSPRSIDGRDKRGPDQALRATYRSKRVHHRSSAKTGCIAAPISANCAMGMKPAVPTTARRRLFYAISTDNNDQTRPPFIPRVNSSDFLVEASICIAASNVFAHWPRNDSFPLRDIKILPPLTRSGRGPCEVQIHPRMKRHRQDTGVFTVAVERRIARTVTAAQNPRRWCRNPPHPHRSTGLFRVQPRQFRSKPCPVTASTEKHR